MSGSLREKLTMLVQAEDAVLAELKRLYPVGTSVTVWLMHGQINPSSGEVIGWEGGRWGNVVVRLDSRARDVKRVAVDNIHSATIPAGLTLRRGKPAKKGASK